MPTVLYYGSGSPYAWRVWLALEQKGVPHELKTLSFAAGDLKTADFSALNPRRRVPVLVDDGFALYESAVIVEYIEERWPEGPPLFAADVRERAVQRRMVREADQYLARVIERIGADGGAQAAAGELREELTYWESVIRRPCHRRAFGRRSNALSVSCARLADCRPSAGVRSEQPPRAAPVRLARPDARPPDHPENLAAALEVIELCATCS